MNARQDSGAASDGILISATSSQLRISVKQEDQAFIDDLFTCLVDLVSAYTGKDIGCCVSSHDRNLLVELDQPKQQLFLTLFRSVVDEVNHRRHSA